MVHFSNLQPRIFICYKQIEDLGSLHKWDIHGHDGDTSQPTVMYNFQTNHIITYIYLY